MSSCDELVLLEISQRERRAKNLRKLLEKQSQPSSHDPASPTEPSDAAPRAVNTTTSRSSIQSTGRKKKPPVESTERNARSPQSKKATSSAELSWLDSLLSEDDSDSRKKRNQSPSAAKPSTGVLSTVRKSPPLQKKPSAKRSLKKRLLDDSDDESVEGMLSWFKPQAKKNDATTSSHENMTESPGRSPNKEIAKLPSKLLSPAAKRVSPEEPDGDDGPDPNAKKRNSSNPRDEEEKAVVPLHNPIVMERQRQVFHRRSQDDPSDYSKKNDDGLWSDSDPEPEEEEEKAKKKRSSKTKSSAGSSTSTKSSKSGKSTLSSRQPDSTNVLNCMDDLTDESEARLKEQLKPDFDPAKLKFGPFPFEKKVLRHGNDDEIPPAIRRFLPDYQLEGIQFLYKAIMDEQGAILGDDMGLGKTVQIVSLLAALFQKTGTGLDLLDLKRRQHRISAHLQSVRREEQRVIESGLLPAQVLSNREDELKKLLAEIVPHQWLPVLIVVPPSLLQNWLNEFDTWGHFNVAAFASNGEDRDATLQEVRNGIAEVLVCSKSLFERNDFQKLNTISWSLIIIDEFHTFKNKDGRLSDNLRRMKRDNKKLLVVGMTGTPMQNNHKELWNLVDLVEKDHLGHWQAFENEIGRPIKLGRAKDADVAAKARGEEKHKELVKLLQGIYIKRDKSEVLHLPSKDERVIFCDLSPVQKVMYERILQLNEFEWLRTAQGPCDCGVNQEFFIKYKKLKTPRERIAYQRQHKDTIVTRRKCCYDRPYLTPGQALVDPEAAIWRSQHEDDEPCEKCPFCIFFPCITKLYKLTSHASLLQLSQQIESYKVGTKPYKTACADLTLARAIMKEDVLSKLPGRSYIRSEGIMDDHLNLSGKLRVLDKLLKGMYEHGTRVLIFSYSTQTLDLIQNFVRSRGYVHCRLDGSTSARNRQDLVDQFQKNSEIFLFLLSTKAGGLGLNLTKANAVIIFDVEWNPSWDSQAQDRAYRIGQEQNVQVIRLVSKGTIDELKYIRQIYKLQLKQETLGDVDDNAAKPARIFRGVEGDKYRKGELFGVENLLKFKDGSFMSDLWKRTQSPTCERSSDLELYDAGALAETLQGMDSEQVERAVGGVDEVFCGACSADSPADSARPKITCDIDGKATPSTAGVAESLHEEAGKDQSAKDVAALLRGEATEDHSDFLRGDRGGAVLEEGDDGFDEEMGGQSQVMVSICEGTVVSDIRAQDGQPGIIKPNVALSTAAEVARDPSGSEVATSPASPQFGVTRTSNSAIPSPLVSASASFSKSGTRPSSLFRSSSSREQIEQQQSGLSQVTASQDSFESNVSRPKRYRPASPSNPVRPSTTGGTGQEESKFGQPFEEAATPSPQASEGPRHLDQTGRQSSAPRPSPTRSGGPNFQVVGLSAERIARGDNKTILSGWDPVPSYAKKKSRKRKKKL